MLFFNDCSVKVTPYKVSNNYADIESQHFYDMFRQVLVHEFGHSYAGLGDEYYYDDGYETMYPADTEPWEPNLTTKVDFQSKWADMLPDPTGQVGLFEGGGYQSKGVFRPAQECRMKVNEVENFCPVCSRAIIRITDFYTSH